MGDVSPSVNERLDEAASLLEKIAENPYEYDAHVQYITKLRQVGPTAAEELRQGRQLLHSFFPLSEGAHNCYALITLLELWIQWLDDEEQVAESAEQIENIRDLYDLAVTDYLCKAP